MKIHIFLPLVLLLIAAQAAPLMLTSPLAGDVLRGPIAITGNMDLPNFQAARLDFAYASDPTGAWFPLQTFSQPTADSTLYTWDTTAITDGAYTLRLQVTLTDGTTQEVTVAITIQNDSVPPTPTALPTSTPEPAPQIEIPTPFFLAASPTPTAEPRPSPTPLPANPIALTQNEILLSLGRGTLIILGVFLLAGLLIRLRRA